MIFVVSERFERVRVFKIHRTTSSVDRTEQEVIRVQAFDVDASRQREIFAIVVGLQNGSNFLVIEALGV